MTTEERRRPAVGAQVKRWRTERGMTLANVAERTGLNVGYLSQIENDKASPSLTCLASIGDALDVPIAWFFLDEVPAPTVVRAAERPVTVTRRSRPDRAGRRRRHARPRRSSKGVAPAGGRAGLHAHAGDEHHLVLRGRWRMSQGDHVVELGPGRLHPLGRHDPARRRGHRRRGGPRPHRDPPREVLSGGTSVRRLLRGSRPPSSGRAAGGPPGRTSRRR